MLLASIQLDINVDVSVSKRFIKNMDLKTILLGKYDWNTPKSQLKGRTVRRSTVDNHVIASTTEEPDESNNLLVASGDLLDDAVQSEKEEEELDLTPSDGWTNGEVFVGSRLCSESYRQSRSKLNMENQRYESPLSYFLFFFAT
ncbi:hypothetical protein G6F42_026414 [Rhizopus arrhizus]|nr:hypothetical protein G6F42_026414 [Rhizopus arrhizus]